MGLISEPTYYAIPRSGELYIINGNGIPKETSGKTTVPERWWKDSTISQKIEFSIKF